ncbi:ErfK/YbiS/YcfS/YnhG family protein [Roseobacter sp. AzwK-3b]|jgi:murein L,D-transpeptidase YafK|uniref:L,D-transpeptidase family protein n=1 Tax=Roseobacter sp. AzwK-3b TaxID=351016 RepID=UPI0001569E0E|nr:L,D-transpeptidase family protein [Roseobacter sp. AzwK-3b]EDM73144.1 ErfK/YbiS/YcfS/YnhG family protein [Roseobacter sp. AzwK-3b]
MRVIRGLVGALLLVALTACSGSKFRTYNGPEVTRIIVNKGEREMHLLHHGRVLRSFDIHLGFAPEGHKQVEGDGKTPEGEYFIDRRNPNSSFHLSIGISYPNEMDVARAASMGMSPGGDIFIHGAPQTVRRHRPDWTEGCIAVTDKEMEIIYAMVKDGTPITINP